jgi:hypothetical protein
MAPRISRRDTQDGSQDRPLGITGLAAAKLRSGDGWHESTTVAVFNEILYVYPAHVKKAPAMALLSGKL